MASVDFTGLNKRYGDHSVVCDLNLKIADGEFLVIVGPSGCGKSTTLRMLAGLTSATSGHIHIGETDVTEYSPGDRDIAMVFQNYALYPHMTVYANLAFGARARGEDKHLIEKNIHEVARTLGLGELLNRHPKDLSGGQRQRVALGRALIRKPRVFLLDEPLSNLDAKLRVQMRKELLKLHDRWRVTTVYVTHDQIEAMTMGDRIAVMHGGELQQVGTPSEIYEEPRNLFVATFIGSPGMNIFQGIVSGDEHPILEWPGGKIIIPTELFKRGKESYRGRVLVGIRPHDLHWACRAAETAICKVDATVEFVEALGSEDHITVNIDGSSAVCVFPTMSGKKSSDPVSLACDPCRFHLFEPEEEGGEVVGGPSLGWQSNTPLVDNVESMSVAPAANPQ